jgi:hypothetical protein
MSAVASARLAPSAALEHPEAVGPVGRLGRWTVDHGRAVAIAWIVIVIGFGFFAPKVESALSGAGWQANGSQSVQARSLIQANFAGLSSSGANGRRALADADGVLSGLSSHPGVRGAHAPHQQARRVGRAAMRLGGPSMRE